MEDWSAISVDEIETEDIGFILDYWFGSDDAYLIGMGADPERFPSKGLFQQMLLQQIEASYEEKEGYCLIWKFEGTPIGHCNIDRIIFGDHAYMHLHLWENVKRNKGFGTELLKMSIPYFFKNLELEMLYCQPNAYNPAPNRIIPKVGFEFVKKWRTIPGYLNFEQEVNLYRMSKERYLKRFT